MELLKLPGNIVIPLLTTAEAATWLSDGPIDREVIIDQDRVAIVYYDIDLDDEVVIPLGGGSSMYVLDTTATIGETKVEVPGLIGATVSAVFRQGTGRRVVTSPTTNTMEVYFDSTTGDINLSTGDAFEDAEWVQIWYSGVSPISP